MRWRTRVLWHIALADFRERSRRYSFVLTLAFAGYLGFLVNSGQMALRIGRYQGELNSAWIGVQMTLVTNTLLGLFGFFLVKNSVERDITTGVAQILATTPMTARQYLLGKWCSHFVTLSAMTLILGAWAMFMQLTRAGSGGVDIPALLAPLVVISIPMMALTASLAVLFESIPRLRGSLGNAAYFFLFNVGLVQLVGINGRFVPFDPVGFGTIVPPLMQSAEAAFPAYTGGVTLSMSSRATLGTFPWNGLDWTAGVILGHAAWVVASLGLVMVAALLFSRASSSSSQYVQVPRAGRRAKPEPIGEPTIEREKAPGELRRLSDVAAVAQSGAGFRLFVGELRLMVKGRPWWWKAVGAGCLLVPLMVSEAAAHRGLLPVAWIWPIALWSGLGCREVRHGVQALIYSAPRPLTQQLMASWLAGLVVALVAGAGVALRLLLQGDAHALGAWLAASAFIPSLALALGSVSGTNRLFETVYALWWYVGPVNGLPALDFMGTTGSSSRPALYMVLAVLLAGVAAAGRKVRMLRA